MLTLESLLERQEAVRLTLGTQTLVADILGSSVSHKDTGAQKHYFGVFPPAYESQDLDPYTSWSAPILGVLIPISQIHADIATPAGYTSIGTRPLVTPGASPARQQAEYEHWNTQISRQRPQYSAHTSKPAYHWYFPWAPTVRQDGT